MRLLWAFACRSIQLVEGGGVANVAGIGIDGMLVPAIPHTDASILVLGRVAEHETDADRAAEFEVDLYGPGMSVLENLEFEFAIGDLNPARPSGWEPTSLIVLKVEFEVNAEGTHGVEIRIDGKLQRDLIWMDIRKVPDAPPADLAG